MPPKDTTRRHRSLKSWLTGLPPKFVLERTFGFRGLYRELSEFRGIIGPIPGSQLFATHNEKHNKENPCHLVGDFHGPSVALILTACFSGFLGDGQVLTTAQRS
jgi:hypothetical protein